MLLVFATNDLVESADQRFLDGIALNKQGLPVPVECCPNRLWGEDDLPAYEKRVPLDKPLPHLFEAAGQWFVSDKAARIINQFDLGSGALYPVGEGVFRKDRTTRVPGDYFCWIFGNTKEAFLPDETPRKEAFGIGGKTWCMPDKPVDGDVAITRSAIVGPDVWVDPGLFKAIFLSGPLGDALQEAGMGKAFRLACCRVA